MEHHRSPSGLSRRLMGNFPSRKPRERHTGGEDPSDFMDSYEEPFLERRRSDPISARNRVSGGFQYREGNSGREDRVLQYSQRREVPVFRGRGRTDGYGQSRTRRGESVREPRENFRMESQEAREHWDDCGIGYSDREQRYGGKRLESGGRPMAYPQAMNWRPQEGKPEGDLRYKIKSPGRNLRYKSEGPTENARYRSETRGRDMRYAADEPEQYSRVKSSAHGRNLRYAPEEPERYSRYEFDAHETDVSYALQYSKHQYDAHGDLGYATEEPERYARHEFDALEGDLGYALGEPEQYLGQQFDDHESDLGYAVEEPEGFSRYRAENRERNFRLEMEKDEWDPKCESEALDESERDLRCMAEESEWSSRHHTEAYRERKREVRQIFAVAESKRDLRHKISRPEWDLRHKVGFRRKAHVGYGEVREDSSRPAYRGIDQSGRRKRTEEHRLDHSTAKEWDSKGRQNYFRRGNPYLRDEDESRNAQTQGRKDIKEPKFYRPQSTTWRGHQKDGPRTSFQARMDGEQQKDTHTHSSHRNEAEDDDKNQVLGDDETPAPEMKKHTAESLAESVPSSLDSSSSVVKEFSSEQPRCEAGNNPSRMETEEFRQTTISDMETQGEEAMMRNTLEDAEFRDVVDETFSFYKKNSTSAKVRTSDELPCSLTDSRRRTFLPKTCEEPSEKTQSRKFSRERNVPRKMSGQNFLFTDRTSASHDKGTTIITPEERAAASGSEGKEKRGEKMPLTPIHSSEGELSNTTGIRADQNVPCDEPESASLKLPSGNSNRVPKSDSILPDKKGQVLADTEADQVPEKHFLAVIVGAGASEQKDKKSVTPGSLSHQTTAAVRSSVISPKFVALAPTVSEAKKEAIKIDRVDKEQRGSLSVDKRTHEISDRELEANDAAGADLAGKERNVARRESSENGDAWKSPDVSPSKSLQLDAEGIEFETTTSATSDKPAPVQVLTCRTVVPTRCAVKTHSHLASNYCPDSPNALPTAPERGESKESPQAYSKRDVCPKLAVGQLQTSPVFAVRLPQSVDIAPAVAAAIDNSSDALFDLGNTPKQFCDVQFHGRVRERACQSLAPISVEGGALSCLESGPNSRVRAQAQQRATQGDSLQHRRPPSGHTDRGCRATDDSFSDRNDSDDEMLRLYDDDNDGVDDNLLSPVTSKAWTAGNTTAHPMRPRVLSNPRLRCRGAGGSARFVRSSSGANNTCKQPRQSDASGDSLNTESAPSCRVAAAEPTLSREFSNLSVRAVPPEPTAGSDGPADAALPLTPDAGSEVAVTEFHSIKSENRQADSEATTPDESRNSLSVREQASPGVESSAEIDEMLRTDDLTVGTERDSPFHPGEANLKITLKRHRSKEKAVASPTSSRTKPSPDRGVRVQRVEKQAVQFVPLESTCSSATKGFLFGTSSDIPSHSLCASEDTGVSQMFKKLDLTTTEEAESERVQTFQTRAPHRSSGKGAGIEEHSEDALGGKPQTRSPPGWVVMDGGSQASCSVRSQNGAVVSSEHELQTQGTDVDCSQREGAGKDPLPLPAQGNLSQYVPMPSGRLTEEDISTFTRKARSDTGGKTALAEKKRGVHSSRRQEQVGSESSSSVSQVEMTKAETGSSARELSVCGEDDQKEERTESKAKSLELFWKSEGRKCPGAYSDLKIQLKKKSSSHENNPSYEEIVSAIALQEPEIVEGVTSTSMSSPVFSDLNNLENVPMDIDDDTDCAGGIECVSTPSPSILPFYASFTPVSFPQQPFSYVPLYHQNPTQGVPVPPPPIPFPPPSLSQPPPLPPHPYASWVPSADASSFSTNRYLQPPPPLEPPPPLPPLPPPSPPHTPCVPCGRSDTSQDPSEDFVRLELSEKAKLHCSGIFAETVPEERLSEGFSMNRPIPTLCDSRSSDCRLEMGSQDARSSNLIDLTPNHLHFSNTQKGISGESADTPERRGKYAHDQQRRNNSGSCQREGNKDFDQRRSSERGETLSQHDDGNPIKSHFRYEKSNQNLGSKVHQHRHHSHKHLQTKDHLGTREFSDVGDRLTSSVRQSSEAWDVQAASSHASSSSSSATPTGHFPTTHQAASACALKRSSAKQEKPSSKHTLLWKAKSYPQSGRRYLDEKDVGSNHPPLSERTLDRSASLSSACQPTSSSTGIPVGRNSLHGGRSPDTQVRPDSSRDYQRLSRSDSADSPEAVRECKGENESKNRRATEHPSILEKTPGMHTSALRLLTRQESARETQPQTAESSRKYSSDGRDVPEASLLEETGEEYEVQEKHLKAPHTFTVGNSSEKEIEFSAPAASTGTTCGSGAVQNVAMTTESVDSVPEDSFLSDDNPLPGSSRAPTQRKPLTPEDESSVSGMCGQDEVMNTQGGGDGDMDTATFGESCLAESSSWDAMEDQTAEQQVLVSTEGVKVDDRRTSDKPDVIRDTSSEARPEVSRSDESFKEPSASRAADGRTGSHQGSRHHKDHGRKVSRDKGKSGKLGHTGHKTALKAHSRIERSESWSRGFCSEVSKSLKHYKIPKKKSLDESGEDAGVGEQRMKKMASRSLSQPSTSTSPLQGAQLETAWQQLPPLPLAGSPLQRSSEQESGVDQEGGNPVSTGRGLAGGGGQSAVDATPLPPSSKTARNRLPSSPPSDSDSDSDSDLEEVIFLESRPSGSEQESKTSRLTDAELPVSPGQSRPSAHHTCSSLDILLADVRKEAEENREHLERRRRLKEEIENKEKNKVRGKNTQESQELNETQLKTLKQLKMPDTVIQEVHPGERVFHSDLRQSLFTASLSPLDCGFTPGSGQLDHFLTSPGEEAVKHLIISEVLNLCSQKFSNFNTILNWVFLMMSVHEDALVVHGCQRSIITHLEQELLEIQQSQDANSFTWAPPLHLVVRAFLNMGVQLESILPDHSVLSPDQLRDANVRIVDENAQPDAVGRNNEDRVPMENLQALLESLSYLLQARPNYMEKELSALFIMLAKISLEMDLRDAYLDYEISNCLDSILSNFPEESFSETMYSLAVQLSQVTEHHHNRVHLCSVLPKGLMGGRVRQCFAFLALHQMLSLPAPNAETTQNIQVGDCLLLVGHFHRLQSHLDRLYSAVLLLDCSVGTGCSLLQDPEGLAALNDMLQPLRGKIRENGSNLDVSKVKNSMVKLSSRWNLLIKHSSASKNSVFSALGQVQPEVRQEVEDSCRNSTGAAEEMLVETGFENDEDVYIVDSNEDMLPDI